MVGQGGSIHTHMFAGASAAALTAVPAADAEIQPYYNAPEALFLGQQAGIEARAAMAGIYGVQIIQEPAYIFGETIAVADAPYSVEDSIDAMPAEGFIGDYSRMAPVNKIVPRDADMQAYMDGPGTDNDVILAHLLYGPPLYVDQLPGKYFRRLLEDANDCAAQTWEEFEQSPVNDLDPSKLYALVGIGGIGEAAPLQGVRVTCPSFNGLAPKGLGGNKPNWVYDPRNGRRLAFGIFSGAESLTVEQYGSAGKHAAILEFIEINNTGAVSPVGSVNIAPGGGFRPGSMAGPGAILGLLGGLTR